MSVLVYAEANDGKFKKASFEAVTYAAEIAGATGTNCVAVVIGAADADELAKLGNYGAAKVLHAGDEKLNSFYSKAYSKVISEAAKAEGAGVVILGHNSSGKALAGRVAVRLDAGLVSAVSAMPDTAGGFKVQKSVFSGKAVADFEINSEVKVLTLNANSLPPKETGGSAEVSAFAPELAESDFDVQIMSREAQADGVAPLPEAELVVSGGRGLKGPENWGIVEELANELGATTACSRPVADTGWRPHHEHVGQTGVAIKPNLYIAIGISGAIQHLAGVNQSKTIVVVNKDPEAPFFKAADYGIVGDAFDVVPRITAALRKFKESQN